MIILTNIIGPELLELFENVTWVGFQRRLCADVSTV